LLTLAAFANACCRFSVVFDGQISLEKGKKYVIPGEPFCQMQSTVVLSGAGTSGAI
jgi:hypothetical protein